MNTLEQPNMAAQDQSLVYLNAGSRSVPQWVLRAGTAAVKQTKNKEKQSRAHETVENKGVSFVFPRSD